MTPPNDDAGPERDAESGRFTSPDDGDDGDDHASSANRDDHADGDDAADRGLPSRPPARTMTEREILSFLEDVLAEQDRWRGASSRLRPGGGPRPAPPESASRESHNDRHGGESRHAEGDGKGETPADACVLMERHVEALETEGYEVRDVPPTAGRGRTASASYALVSVAAPEGVEPGRSIAEVLAETDSNGSNAE